MKKRAPIKTTIKQAVEYWQSRVDEDELSVDWNEATMHCWRCGCERNLERCHIIPDTLGGKDAPENIVLLCKRCHQEGPNVEDPDVMWDWIKAYSVPFYNTFWNIQAMKEYEFIYKHTLIEDLQYIWEYVPDKTSSDEFAEFFKNFLTDMSEKTSIHFGQPYLNTATIAGMFRMALKKLAAQYGIGLKK